MASFLKNQVKNNMSINDEVIANSMLGAAAGAANAYLNASMACATPELRAMYGASLSQILVGHSGLMELAINKGWEKPYDPPTQQLTEIYNKATDTLQS